MALLGLMGLLGCVPPSPQNLYAPYLKAHRWVYTTDTRSPKTVYKSTLEVKAVPQGRQKSLIRVHISPDPKEPGVGARQSYLLDFSSLPPRLELLITEGGQARLEPGFPLPGFSTERGQLSAQYASGRGYLAGQRHTVNWSYTPRQDHILETPAGLFSTRRVDLEFRTSLKLTDAFVRLDFAPGIGIVRAEWNTGYEYTTVFTLKSFE
jgi:hypothetical protein